MTIWPQLNHCQTAQAVRISGRGEVVEAPAPARKQTANKIRFNIDPPSDFCSRASDKRLSSVSVAQVSQKLNQGISRLFWFFLEHPMSGIFQDDHRGIGSHNLHLLPQQISVCLPAADRKDRHGQLGLRKFREIFGCLLKGDEIGPARAHSSWTSIGRRISYAIGFWNRMSFVGREVVPEMFKVNPLAPAHQRFRRRTVKTEVPNAWVVINVLPPGNTREKRIHHHYSLHLRRARRDDVRGGISSCLRRKQRSEEKHKESNSHPQFGTEVHSNSFQNVFENCHSTLRRYSRS